MRSKLSEELRRELLEANQRLTPERRLQAFVAHSRAIAQIHEAGRKFREREVTVRRR